MIFSGSTSDNVGRILTPDEIRLFQPERLPVGAKLASAKERMQTTNQWDRSQFMGRRWPIGCVALEITQRCNLDCTACYLSDNSEAVKDVPLEELFRRIDMIFDHYGPGTGVQVTGGDPTLRQRTELVDIVRRIAEKGMQPALFTNGIRAKRDLLAELAEAGLVDVVFHVDMTQRRRGFDSEAQLNRVRLNYIDRARGLPIAVMFNTTVTNANFDQIPDVAAFFVRNSDIVRLASFQIQADTGRGTLGRRGEVLNMKSVQGQIEAGANAPISFDTASIGHIRCNRYAMTFVANGHVYDALDSVKLFQAVLEGTAHRGFDRRSKAVAASSFLIGLLRRPLLLPRVLAWLVRKIWIAKAEILAARGRVNKLSFFIHNFMDACSLEKQRIDACSFMVATQAGPISMCLHNAKRDDFILAPLRIGRNSQAKLWDPLTGDLVSESVPSERVAILWNNMPQKPRKAVNPE
jgi:hypothetical protein